MANLTQPATAVVDPPYVLDDNAKAMFGVSIGVSAIVLGVECWNFYRYRNQHMEACATGAHALHLAVAVSMIVLSGLLLGLDPKDAEPVVYAELITYWCVIISSFMTISGANQVATDRARADAKALDEEPVPEVVATNGRIDQSKQRTKSIANGVRLGGLTFAGLGLGFQVVMPPLKDTWQPDEPWFLSCLLFGVMMYQITLIMTIMIEETSVTEQGLWNLVHAYNAGKNGLRDTAKNMQVAVNGGTSVQQRYHPAPQERQMTQPRQVQQIQTPRTSVTDQPPPNHTNSWGPAPAFNQGLYNNNNTHSPFVPSASLQTNPLLGAAPTPLPIATPNTQSETAEKSRVGRVIVMLIVSLGMLVTSPMWVCSSSSSMTQISTRLMLWSFFRACSMVVTVTDSTDMQSHS